jgi:hypothetical protein
LGQADSTSGQPKLALFSQVLRNVHALNIYESARSGTAFGYCALSTSVANEGRAYFRNLERSKWEHCCKTYAMAHECC